MSENVQLAKQIGGKAELMAEQARAFAAEARKLKQQAKSKAWWDV